MMTAPIPHEERARLAVLHDIGPLLPGSSETCERVVALAARVLDVPIALVSLVDEDRQFFMARVGLTVCETGRDVAFCSHAITGTGELLVVPDALLDERFADNPLVTGDPMIRFYAGQPLCVRGRLLGTLCIIDRHPRNLTTHERQTLADLGAIVEDALARTEVDAAVLALERSESRKDQILATMHDGLVVQDSTGAIVSWNEAAERALGLNGDELSGRTSMDPRWAVIRSDGSAWPGDTHPSIEALRTGKRVENAVMGVHRPNIGLGWLRVNSTPVLEPDGSASSVITSFADITELTETDIQLRAVERLQRVTLDLLEHGVIVTLATGEIEIMNAAAERILGFTSAQLTEKWRSGTWMTFSADGTLLEPERRPMVRTFRDREHVIAETVGWDRQDGRRVLLSLSSSPIPSDPNRFMVTFVDVTSRHRDRKLLELTFANAPIGMALLDHRGRFIHVNESLCTILDRDRDPLLALRFQDVTHPEDQDNDMRQVMSLLDGTIESYETDKRYLRPDGSTVHAHLAVATLRSPTLRHPFFLAQVTNIESRLETERAKDDALAAERAAVVALVELDQIKTDLVSTVSHELRTPLTSMIAYLELLQEDEPPPVSQQRSMLEVVDRNAHRLLALIENLLTLAKVEVDQQQASRTRTETAALIAIALSTVSLLASDAGVTIHTKLDPTARPIMANAGQLERVLLNLLTNAIKFTPAGGTITITTVQAEGTLQLEVQDDGIGIPADELPHLFTRFFRSSTTTAKAIPGTGLGLTIAENIVRNHGGTISVHRVEPRGTAFVVKLPSVDPN